MSIYVTGGEEHEDEMERLRNLVYSYPPHDCFAPDGVTWKQEAEDLRSRLAELERLAGAVCDVCSGGVVEKLRSFLGDKP